MPTTSYNAGIDIITEKYWTWP